MGDRTTNIDSAKDALNSLLSALCSSLDLQLSKSYRHCENCGKHINTKEVE